MVFAMADGAIVKDNSPEARDALRALSLRHEEPDAELIRTELEANAYWNQCDREVAAERMAEARRAAVKKRKDELEHRVTEGAEVMASILAGVLATWKTADGRPIGDPISGIIGLASKASSVSNPDSRPLRVAARAGKVMFHSQLSMFTRNLIENR